NSNAPFNSNELWLCNKCCHHLAGTNSGMTTVMISSSRLRSNWQMYPSNGPVSSRYGEGNTTRLTPFPHRSHFSRGLAVVSSSKSTYTAVTFCGAIDFAYCSALITPRWTPEMGTMTVLLRAPGGPSPLVDNCRATLR